MAAPIGNEFWKLRSKHGRDKIFSSPEILWDACNEYFQVTSTRVWVKKDWVGKDALEVNRETSVPFTQAGLYIFLNIVAQTWLEYKKLQDFSDVIARAEQIIYNQKFEGAAVGAYNANIIARDLGLAEKKDVEKTIKKIKFTDAAG